MHVSQRRSVAIAKAADDQAWRRRTVLACGAMATGVLAFGAAGMDWSQGPAMVLGQMAGMAAPLAGFGLAVWGATVFAGRRR